MRINPNMNIVDFLQTAATCKGEVIYQTMEGDRLNLKSELCQYIFATIAAKPELLMRGEIVCTISEDTQRLQEFCFRSEGDGE